MSAISGSTRSVFHSILQQIWMFLEAPLLSPRATCTLSALPLTPPVHCGPSQKHSFSQWFFNIFKESPSCNQVMFTDDECVLSRSGPAWPGTSRSAIVKTLIFTRFLKVFGETIALLRRSKYQFRGNRCRQRNFNGRTSETHVFPLFLRVPLRNPVAQTLTASH